MVFQLWILGIVTFMAPLVPPIFSPLGYILTGMLVAQKANPRLLSLITVGVATLTSIIIRKVQNHVIERLTIYEEIKGNSLFSRIVSKVNTYFKNQKRMTRIGLKREKYIETKTGKVATFMFAIFCFLPILPDIVGTRILYKKIKFPYFIIAVIIGKSVTHVPFIFVGKTIIQLLGL
ncbi:MAG: hypothetical protein NTY80_04140 [candidate division SR1 bacterium]|nr:hypothetical protein [candidate division SR1 bacterium]